MLLLLVLVELVLLLLLLGEDMDGRLWLRKTPGAMGCGPPEDFTVPVLNSWSVRLPSWESRLCSGELLSWEIFSGSSITIAFFLVLFFFFLVFCCSSYWHIFFGWATAKRIVADIMWNLLMMIPDAKALLQLQPVLFLWRPLGLRLLPVALAEEPRVLRGLRWQQCTGSLHMELTKLLKAATFWYTAHVHLSGCMAYRRCFSAFLIWIWKQDYLLRTPTRDKLKWTNTFSIIVPYLRDSARFQCTFFNFPWI